LKLPVLVDVAVICKYMEVQEGRKGIPSLLSLQGECIASNITQLIGWTPLIELKNIAKKDGIYARLIGKIEPYQPLSSVKDRSALRDSKFAD